MMTTELKGHSSMYKQGYYQGQKELYRQLKEE
jgi:hypothetical protein